ncbi:SET domain-containing protein [Lizonia empirigonia]|nr:SET domain-containing protein [Lizonia empirigonia]
MALPTVDGGLFLKATDDIDNGPVPNWGVDPSSTQQFSTQTSTNTWAEDEWNRAPRPQEWPADDPWPPAFPDVLQSSAWDYANTPCLACGKTARRARDRCSCSIALYRTDQGFASNLELRSLTTNGVGVGVFPQPSRGKIAAGTVVGEFCGEMRPLPPDFADYTDQLRQFSTFFPIYSPSHLIASSCRKIGIDAWHDASQQRSVLYFAGHSCEPNLDHFFSRVGPTRGIFVKTTRDLEIWDELTFDWAEMRLRRPCQDSDFNCLCVRMASGKQ